MNNILIFMIVFSFQSVANVNDDECFNHLYLPEINKCIKSELNSNESALEKQYGELETRIKRTSPDNAKENEKYWMEIIQNKKDWEKVSSDFCKIQSYFVDEKTITYEIQFNQCRNAKITYQISEIENLYEIADSML